MEILVLTEDDIRKVFTMREAISASKDALAYYSQGKSQIPLRINLNIEDFQGDSLYMPGHVGPAEALGLKIVSTYPENPKKGLPSVPATMVLLDSSTGQVNSIMDGTYLTKLRTGAVAGAGTDELAREDARVFLMFGTGGQAEEQLEAVLNVRPIEKAIIFGGRNQEKAQAFVDEMKEKYSEKFNVSIELGKDRDQAVREADIITAVTTSRQPVFNGELVKLGCHINGVGSYTPEMVELDSKAVCNCDKIFVDTLEGVINESGDFIDPIEKGELDPKSITGELGELISADKPGRESEEEITLFKTTGTAVLDLVTGKRIYDKAKEMGIGQVIEM